MPKKSLPSLRRQRRPNGWNDVAFVEFRGRRIYFGAWGSSEAKEAYRRFLAELSSEPAIRSGARESVPLVAELVAAFLDHVESYYTRDGVPTSEVGNFRNALAPLVQLYGAVPTSEFGPRAFRALREDAWVGKALEEGEKPLARSTINGYARRVRQAFKWGVAHELVAPSVLEGLRAVDGLRSGRSAARETEPVRPVLEAHVQAVEPFVSRQVWHLIQLQLATGARSGELVGLRVSDLDRSTRTWATRFGRHKTSHHGRSRTLYFGPRARAILERALVGRGPSDYLFSPVEAEAARREAQRARRRTPASCGNRAGSNRKADPKRTPGPCYTTDSYRQAIVRACVTAKIPPWTPHQLRHAAATEIRRDFGLDEAKAVLGHSSPSVTEIYAERDAEVAQRIAEQRG